MNHQKWKILSKEDVSPSKWFPVQKEEVELPNGGKIEYFKSQLPDVSMVVPFTTKNELIFVRQYKHGIGEVCLEFPAGRIEIGKTPEQTAINELKEETGITVDETQLTKLIELWTEPSKSSVRVHGFLAQNLEMGGLQQLEETEQIEIVKIPSKEVHSLLESGELHASDTVALLFLVRAKFPHLFNYF